MVTKIEDRKTITLEEAQEEYKDFRFFFVITDNNTALDEARKGYVAYIYNESRDSLQIPRDEFNGKHVLITNGNNFGEYPSIDRVVVGREIWTKLS